MKKRTRAINTKSSLFVKLAIAMVLLVMVTVGLNWLMNVGFLEDYYLYNKEKTLLSAYEIIDQACRDDVLEEESFDVPFEKICSNGNISILIMQSGAAGPNKAILRSSYVNEQDAVMQFAEIIAGVDQEEPRVLLTTDNYIVQRKNDNRMDAEYLVLIGNLSDGSSIYMKTALESIRESAQISNRFSLMAGAVALIICAVISLLMATGIAKPMKQLTQLSKRMSELDFEARYYPMRGGTKEIDELGHYMNEMSEALEETITQLKNANNELQKDIEKKEQIDEMRKEFLSNVSHELKTPLALIQGYAEGLRDGITDDPESQQFYCDVIVDEADKMNELIKKLLTLNQLEFGNDAADMTHFDIAELIQGVVSASSLMLASEHITLEYLNPGPTYVWGDEFKVEEVITNYLSNAIHYALGEKIIRISMEEKEGLLRVSVFNTGNPIPEDDLDKVWIKFYKVDKARTREYGGNGIGLSIVKAIMESMNRQCGVINHEDGVEFWMELELAGEVPPLIEEE